MSTFVLTVLEDGGCILTTERKLSPEMVRHIQDLFEKWRQTAEGILVIQECRVQYAKSVEIELPGDEP